MNYLSGYELYIFSYWNVANSLLVSYTVLLAYTSNRSVWQDCDYAAVGIYYPLYRPKYCKQFKETLKNIFDNTLNFKNLNRFFWNENPNGMCDFRDTAHSENTQQYNKQLMKYKSS